MEDSMELDSLNIAKSLPDFAKHIRGIVPQFGGKCFDITLESAEKAAELANAGFDYGDVRKPLRLLGKRSINVSVFVSVEFPDEELVKLLSTYGELKSANLRRYTIRRLVIRILKMASGSPSLPQSREIFLNASWSVALRSGSNIQVNPARAIAVTQPSR